METENISQPVVSDSDSEGRPYQLLILDEDADPYERELIWAKSDAAAIAEGQSLANATAQWVKVSIVHIMDQPLADASEKIAIVEPNLDF